MSTPGGLHDDRDSQVKTNVSETTYPVHDKNTLWSKPQDLDAIATKRSVFDDDELGKFYAPPADYENAHRFDPTFRWTFREERAVLRKVDFRILLWVLVMFFGLNIDRGT
jgi:hypothetical protein